MSHFCFACKETKPDDQFYVIKKTGKFRPYCRPCQKVVSARAYATNPRIRMMNARYRDTPERREKQRQRVRNWHYKTHYGLSEEDKRVLEQMQGNRCAICKTHFLEIDQRSIHVDHCHATGIIRGILCHHCNQVLGQSKDNPAVLVAAIEYLADSKDMLSELRRRHDNGIDAFAS